MNTTSYRDARPHQTSLKVSKHQMRPSDQLRILSLNGLSTVDFQPPPSFLQNQLIFPDFHDYVTDQLTGEQTRPRWAQWFSNRRVEYWATRSSVRSFARTFHSSACSALLASLRRSAALIHLLACSLASLWESGWLNVWKRPGFAQQCVSYFKAGIRWEVMLSIDVEGKFCSLSLKTLL